MSKSNGRETLMGKRYEALLKNGRQRQSENNQPSILTATSQRWDSWPSQKIFTERFLLDVCLGLAVCNMFVLLLLFFVLNTP